MTSARASVAVVVLLSASILAGCLAGDPTVDPSDVASGTDDAPESVDGTVRRTSYNGTTAPKACPQTAAEPRCVEVTSGDWGRNEFVDLPFDGVPRQVRGTVRWDPPPVVNAWMNVTLFERVGGGWQTIAEGNASSWDGPPLRFNVSLAPKRRDLGLEVSTLPLADVQAWVAGGEVLLHQDFNVTVGIVDVTGES